MAIKLDCRKRQLSFSKFLDRKCGINVQSYYCEARIYVTKEHRDYIINEDLIQQCHAQRNNKNQMWRPQCQTQKKNRPFRSIKNNFKKQKKITNRLFKSCQKKKKKFQCARKLYVCHLTDKVQKNIDTTWIMEDSKDYSRK